MYKDKLANKSTSIVDLATTKYDERDLIKVDPVRGTRTYMTQQSDGKFLIQDVHPIKEQMHHAELARSNGAVKPLAGNTQRHWAHVAEIPLPIYTLWRSVLGPPTQNPKGWAARLNDPDNKKFRMDTRRI